MRVVGLADSNLLDGDNPMNPLNRRISIIVLNKLAEERMQQAGGEIEAGNADSLEKAAATPRRPPRPGRCRRRRRRPTPAPCGLPTP